MKRDYGITVADYDRMCAEQGGRCAICATDKPGKYPRFCVDHDHKTKRVRGLLCYKCNVGIGHLGDTAEAVAKALAYLLRGR